MCRHGPVLSLLRPSLNEVRVADLVEIDAVVIIMQLRPNCRLETVGDGTLCFAMELYAESTDKVIDKMLGLFGEGLPHVQCERFEGVGSNNATRFHDELNIVVRNVAHLQTVFDHVARVGSVSLDAAALRSADLAVYVVFANWQTHCHVVWLPFIVKSRYGKVVGIVDQK